MLGPLWSSSHSCFVILGFATCFHTRSLENQVGLAQSLVNIGLLAVLDELYFILEPRFDLSGNVEIR
jgi:hypothetical protein